jgi:hypothetical protein
MIYQRHVGGLIVFPVWDVWFNLQDLCFFLTYFVAFCVYMLGYFDFWSRPWVRLYLCSLMHNCKSLLVSLMWQILHRPHVCIVFNVFNVFLNSREWFVLCLVCIACDGAGIQRQGLVLLIGPNWVGSTWRQRQNAVSETLCILNRKRKIDNVQKHNSCMY